MGWRDPETAAPPRPHMSLQISPPTLSWMQRSQRFGMGKRCASRGSPRTVALTSSGCTVSRSAPAVGAVSRSLEAQSRAMASFCSGGESCGTSIQSRLAQMDLWRSGIHGIEPLAVSRSSEPSKHKLRDRAMPIKGSGSSIPFWPTPQHDFVHLGLA